MARGRSYAARKRAAVRRRATRQRKADASRIRRATRKRAVKVVARAKKRGVSIRELSKISRAAVQRIPIKKPFIKPQAPAVIAKEVTGISGKLKLIPVMVIGAIIGAYMLLKRK